MSLRVRFELSCSSITLLSVGSPTDDNPFQFRKIADWMGPVSRDRLRWLSVPYPLDACSVPQSSSNSIQGVADLAINKKTAFGRSWCAGVQANQACVQQKDRLWAVLVHRCAGKPHLGRNSRMLRSIYAILQAGDPLLQGVQGCLYPVRQVQLAEDVADVAAYGCLGDRQSLRDPGIAQPLRQ
jgi:hypothetical protein